MRYLDIDHTCSHLRAAGIRFNSDDKVVVNGDLSELSGTVEVYKGKGPTIRFKIMARENGTFVDYDDGYGKNFIKKVA
jgi:hypothetical protein